MTAAVVFLGPSLPLSDARAILQADYRPPAGFGDVYRAASGRPRPKAICLIDGVFQSVPSVRHKEILWAMSEGIHVFGGASLGALRAAELHSFGMVGVGRVFADYRDGRLQDDDEVAVDHGPPEFGHRPLSEPMVNVRATLAAAETAGLLSAATAAALLSLSKEMFYKRRSYDTVLQAARQSGCAVAELEALRAWLPGGRVDQKRGDAENTLRAVAEFLASAPPPLRPSFHFESSEIWSQERAAAEAHGRPDESAILDEVRLVPGAYERLRREALLMALGLREARRQNVVVSEEARIAAEQAWRRRQGLAGNPDFLRWLADNGVDETERRALFERQAAGETVADMAEPLTERHLFDALRLSGGYGPAAMRAARKRALSDTAETAGSVTKITPAALYEWYFARRLRTPPPPDIEAFARTQGFADAAALLAALRLEYALRMAEDSCAETPGGPP